MVRAGGDSLSDVVGEEGAPTALGNRAGVASSEPAHTSRTDEWDGPAASGTHRSPTRGTDSLFYGAISLSLSYSCSVLPELVAKLCPRNMEADASVSAQDLSARPTLLHYAGCIPGVPRARPGSLRSAQPHPKAGRLTALLDQPRRAGSAGVPTGPTGDRQTSPNRSAPPERERTLQGDLALAA